MTENREIGDNDLAPPDPDLCRIKFNTLGYTGDEMVGKHVGPHQDGGIRIDWFNPNISSITPRQFYAGIALHALIMQGGDAPSDDLISKEAFRYSDFMLEEEDIGG